jgi:hypothetical protein
MSSSVHWRLWKPGRAHLPAAANSSAKPPFTLHTSTEKAGFFCGSPTPTDKYQIMFIEAHCQKDPLPQVGVPWMSVSFTSDLNRLCTHTLVLWPLPLPEQPICNTTSVRAREKHPFWI